MYRTRGNIDVKKTLTNLTKQTIRQYFFHQICLKSASLLFVDQKYLILVELKYI